MFQPADVITFGALYLCGASPQSPEASPVFADLHGLPPLLIQASSSELLLDDARRLHQRAVSRGVNSTLSIFPGVPHVWQIFIGTLPEARHALFEISDFLGAALNQSGVAIAHLEPTGAETGAGSMLPPR